MSSSTLVFQKVRPEDAPAIAFKTSSPTSRFVLSCIDLDRSVLVRLCCPLYTLKGPCMFAPLVFSIFRACTTTNALLFQPAFPVAFACFHLLNPFSCAPCYCRMRVRAAIFNFPYAVLRYCPHQSARLASIEGVPECGCLEDMPIIDNAACST